jgi:hypothetical protein
MTVTIELSPEREAALKAHARARGLTVEQWLTQLAEQHATPEAERPLQAAADIVLNRMRGIPPEALSGMPADGASQHDHYIYGTPKKER